MSARDYVCADGLPPRPGADGPVLCFKVSVGRDALAGDLALPPRARGIVLFGDGGERRGRAFATLAGVLHGLGLATLLLELLRREEAVDAGKRADVELLAQRVGEALDWLRLERVPGHACLGLCAAGRAAAASVLGAAARPTAVAALVSLCGRLDLVADRLPRLRAATLLVVGGDDAELLQGNRQALRALSCVKRLEVLPRASNVLDEAAARATAAHLARAWFAHHVLEDRAV